MSQHQKRSRCPDAWRTQEYRHDPAAVVPPEFTDRELSRGLVHLVNAGLLNPRADLSAALIGGDGAPVRSGAAPLHAHAEQFLRLPATTALEDSLLAAAARPVKLDLITPVGPPAAARAAATATLRSVTVGGAQPSAGAA
eukprot:29692-Chlamydomonas_euryale.AAC.1